MIVHFEKEALEEYRDAALYSEERFGLGQSFVKAIQAALDVIAHGPAHFQSVGDGVRIFRLKRFPYYLYYHHDEKKAIIIYAVAHHGRRPDYWRNRMGD